MILKPDFDLEACCEAAGVDVFDLADDLGVDTHDLNRTEVESEVESILSASSFTKKDFLDVLRGYDAPEDVLSILDGALDDGADPSLPEFKVDQAKIRDAIGAEGFDLESLAEDCSLDVSDLEHDEILDAIMDNWRARLWTEKDLAEIVEIYGGLSH